MEINKEFIENLFRELFPVNNVVIREHVQFAAIEGTENVYYMGKFQYNQDVDLFELSILNNYDMYAPIPGVAYWPAHYLPANGDICLFQKSIAKVNNKCFFIGYKIELV